MVILFVTNGLPQLNAGGTSLRDYYMIRALAQRHEVLCLSLTHSQEEQFASSAVSQIARWGDVVLARPRPFSEKIVAVARGVAAGRPLATHPYYHPELAARIHEIMQNRRVDIVEFEHSFLAPYVTAIPADRRSNVTKVLTFHNIGFEQFRSLLHTRISAGEWFIALLKWFSMWRWESAWARQFDHCLAVSPLDGRLLATHIPGIPISVIDNGTDTDLLQPLPEPAHSTELLFAGSMAYTPNIDAMLYFCREILPLVRQRIPDIKLTIAGRSPVPEVRRLAEHPNVTVTGSVPDMLPYYARSMLSIVPLRAGGGTRLKILESMALGRVVVSTAKGYEGIEHAIAGEHLLSADTPRALADQVVRALQDSALRQQISRQARAMVQTHYNWTHIGQRLEHLYQNLYDDRTNG